MKHELRLRIILEAPPAGIDYALQHGRGPHYETDQTQRSEGSDLTFEFPAEVVGTAAEPDFRGPFVQGPRGSRFVYIGIGTHAGQFDTPWSLRLKVPLSGITTEMLNDGPLLETRVPGRGRNGGPNCATVKPFAGWRPA